jgi:DNA-directed RNA polymerase subunit alpha
MKINVEFSSLGDMVNFADFIGAQADIKANKTTLVEYEKMLKVAQSQLERAYERLREKGITDKQDLTTRIGQLNLTARTYNCFLAENIITLEDIVKCTYNELLKMPNFGRKSLKEVRDMLKDRGLKLKGDL